MDEIEQLEATYKNLLQQRITEVKQENLNAKSRLERDDRRSMNLAGKHQDFQNFSESFRESFARKNNVELKGLKYEEIVDRCCRGVYRDAKQHVDTPGFRG